MTDICLKSLVDLDTCVTRDLIVFKTASCFWLSAHRKLLFRTPLLKLLLNGEFKGSNTKLPGPWYGTTPTTLDLNYHIVTRFDIPHFLKPFEDHIVYLFTVTRQKIWNHRNNIEKGNTNFSARAIITLIQRSIRYRLSLEKNTAMQKHVCVFEKLRAVTTWTLKSPLKPKLRYVAQWR